MQSHVRSLRAGGAGTDEKEGCNYHTYLDSNIASDLLEEEKKTRREISEQPKCISGKWNSQHPLTATIKGRPEMPDERRTEVKFDLKKKKNCSTFLEIFGNFLIENINYSQVNSISE